ncbi:MAG TPA: NDP-sugar synthase [Polyangia bacterium]|nr:NDP-sugar synthase [Polyangia bacterium]
MILAAGLSTRLGELGSERPKPLLPVCDWPLIRYSLALLRAHRVRDVIVNTHHMAELIVDELQGEVTYSHERPGILGTGGGVRQAAWFFGGDRCILINGKIAVDLDLDAVLAHHVRTGALATLVVRPDAEAARWGAIDVDETAGRVRDLRGSGRHMFVGVHVVEPALIEQLPDGPSDIIEAAYRPALARGDVIGAYVMEGYFAEHSTPERYLAGNVHLLRGAVVRHPPGELVGVAADAEVSPKARIIPPVRIGSGAQVAAGASIGPDVVIGRRVRVAARVRLERAVVWPDVHVTASASGVIVTRLRVLPVATSAPGAPAPR